MICKNCGKEIKEGNSFCTNCGKDVNECIENKETLENKVKVKKNNKKIAVKIILPIIIIIIIAIMISIVLKMNKDENTETNVNNETKIEKITDTNIEIGVNYECITEGTIGFIRFNTDKDFIMQTGVENSELFIKIGTYINLENEVKLTVNYNNELNRDDIEESKKMPYNEKIKILENGDLEYANEYNFTLIFSKNVKNSDEEATSENLLDEIYAKYPELKDKEGIICTNGTEYWLLDENGKKVYFEDMESFEKAKEQSGIGKQTIKNDVENSKKVNDKSYIEIPNLQGMTEKQAIEKIKKLNVPYQIKYQEDISKEEGIVLDQSYHNEVITNYKGEIVAAYSRSILYEGETLYVFVNKIKERTINFLLHRTCLAKAYIRDKTGNYVVESINEPLKVVVKADDKIIFNDNLTNQDLDIPQLYMCKTSQVSYTAKRPPTITVLVNDEVFRTYTYEIERKFYEESSQPYILLFEEHGAG